MKTEIAKTIEVQVEEESKSYIFVLDGARFSEDDFGNLALRVKANYNLNGNPWRIRFNLSEIADTKSREYFELARQGYEWKIRRALETAQTI